ncbi:MAG: hypothetical protein K2M36_04910, partial [Clostridia bacterium]|nr:hypothetical protein [Clostridia bacterium]
MISWQSISCFAQNYNTNVKLGEKFIQTSNLDRQLLSSVQVARDNANSYVRIGGKPIGISVTAGGLIVLGQCEVLTDNGAVYPAKDSKIEIGDVITSVNDIKVTSIFQLKKILDEVTEGAVSIGILRDGNAFTTQI